MEARFLARAETKGEKGILKFNSQEASIELLAAHSRRCSAVALDKCLTSRGRTPTDACNWEDFKEVAMQGEPLTTPSNPELQTKESNELYEELWRRLQQNEFPLLNQPNAKMKVK